jgi:hypothetical protein
MSVDITYMDAATVNVMLWDTDLKPFPRGWYWAILWEGLVMLPLDGPYPGPATCRLFAEFYTETAAAKVRCPVTKGLCSDDRCEPRWCRWDEHYP